MIKQFNLLKPQRLFLYYFLISFNCQKFQILKMVGPLNHLINYGYQFHNKLKYRYSQDYQYLNEKVQVLTLKYSLNEKLSEDISNLYKLKKDNQISLPLFQIIQNLGFQNTRDSYIYKISKKWYELDIINITIFVVLNYKLNQTSHKNKSKSQIYDDDCNQIFNTLNYVNQYQPLLSYLSNRFQKQYLPSTYQNMLTFNIIRFKQTSHNQLNRIKVCQQRYDKLIRIRQKSKGDNSCNFNHIKDQSFKIQSVFVEKIKFMT
ncbi:hypothetical protein ABPG74_019323 [Tetrahymena malaccensis]